MISKGIAGSNEMLSSVQDPQEILHGSGNIPNLEEKLSSRSSISDSKNDGSPDQNIDGAVYPPLKKVALVMFALYIAMFLVALVSW